MTTLTPTKGSPLTQASVLIKAKKAYTLWFMISADIPKTYRYTLGAKVEGYFLELLENIFISLYLSPEQKAPRLTIAISKLDGVKFFLQIAWENKCVSHDRYTELSSSLDEIGRMLGGWKKGIEKKTPPR
jgi:hypothetical protein